jgi:hypothetical protein
MSLYAYCLSDEVTEGDLRQVAGVAGAVVRLIEAEGIRAVVSDFDGERAEVTRENVLAHESVIRRVLARATPLPFRFGALVSPAQLAGYVSQNRARLAVSLDRVRGAVEMSVKVLWDVRARRQEGRGQAERQAAVEMAGPGAAFLQEKRREIMMQEGLKKEAQEVAAWLAERVGDAARETAVRLAPDSAIFVAAAHLVDRSRLGQYRARVGDASQARPDLRFLVSGEWAPYSFCEIG